MPRKAAPEPAPFNIAIVGQKGRLSFEAILFAASLRAKSPGFRGRLLVAEPQPGETWDGDPRIAQEDVRQTLTDLGAEIVPFDTPHFGSHYPYGNKIEMLNALPKGEPFQFFATDALILDEISDLPFDFARPSASLRRTGTWPQIELYGTGYTDIWKSLYDMFGLDFDSSLDLGEPDEYWQRYLYFNAGFFFGACPHVFGKLFLDYALAIRDDPPRALVCQSLDPWLDQVALPLVIHALGGGRDSAVHGMLDGTHSCHYRMFPLLYARESEAVIATLEEIAAPNKIKKVLKAYEPIKRMVYQKRGDKVRALFDQNDMPRREQALRNRIKSSGFWMR